MANVLLPGLLSRFSECEYGRFILRNLALLHLRIVPIPLSKGKKVSFKTFYRFRGVLHLFSFQRPRHKATSFRESHHPLETLL